MKTELPFKIFREYVGYTEEDIYPIFKLKDKKTINNWCTKKFPKSKTETVVEDIITNGFFKDDEMMCGFVRHLNRKGYDVSDYDGQNMTEDKFRGLLREFLKGELNKTDSDIYIKKKPTKDITILKFKKPEDDYFTQTLYLSDENNPNCKDIIFDMSEGDFKKINEKKHLLLEAVGGQGKTTFLKHLEQKASQSGEYSYIFYVDLPELVTLKKGDLYQFSDTDTPHIFTYLSSIAEDVSDIASCFADDETKPVLLLLDGLNELFALSDFEKTQKIVSELDFISKEWSNSTIIMTTRPSTEKKSFIDKYKYCLCHISGTPKAKIETLLNENSSISEDIKSLLNIPMYYNGLVKLKEEKNIETKYDLLFAMYLNKYKQSAKTIEAFLAFFVFAPLLAKDMVDNNKNRISYEDVTTFAEKFKEMHLEAFIRLAQRECNISYPVCDIDIDNVCAIFIHKGPVNLSTVTNSKENYKYHDEIRDFLLAYLAAVSMKVFHESLDDGQFIYVQDIDFLLNLKDNACYLLKEKLGLTSGEDLYKLKEQYNILDDCKITGQAILYAYTLFMLSDNLGLGIAAVEPAHNILISFTNRIRRTVKQNNFENCLKESVPENHRIRCKSSMLDVITKHCEYYRKTGKYAEGIKLITDVAEKINPEYDAIRHQKSKLLLLMYESHIKEETIFDLQSLGFSDDYSELYTKGKLLLEESAKNNFNFSNILLSVLYSNPAPFLYDDPKISLEIDYIKAFHLYRTLIFDIRHPRYVTKRVGYALRQVIGLLLKGYVKFNPDFEVYEGGNPGENSVVLGDKNTLSIDENTIELAKHFLQDADGININALNYYRGVIAYYDKDFAAAKHFFDLESDTYLKSIFQNYAFKEDINLDSLYEEIRTKMMDVNNDTVEKCHPVYWYCDAKLLELSFNKERKCFFDKFEENLPELLKKIINQITQ